MSVEETRGTRLLHGGSDFDVRPGETVLDALLRQGVPAGHSCRSGHCHACLVRGTPAPAGSQVGLKATQLERGEFLACQARPSETLVLHAIVPAQVRRAVVVERTRLVAGILRLRLAVDEALDFTPGQFVHIEHPSGALRSDSLAGQPEDPFLELHVRRVAGGLVSGWLHDELRVGAPLTLRGPHGSCTYAPDAPERPMLLAGDPALV